MNQKEILIKSTLDDSLQPSLFYKSDIKGKRPLLVGLHTWSFNRFGEIENMLPLAKKLGFHLLLPEFRGANVKNNSHCREACGSKLAKQDIKDAIDYLIANEEIDTENIFLLGLSGGGHMALLMAGMCPLYFKAIGAYVPITDLTAWVDQSPRYREHVLACCNNDESELKKRSPINYIDTIAKANLKIFHGKYDGIVPFTHSVNLYNEIIKKYPKASVYLDIFDGAHQIDMSTAEYWILSQYKKGELTKVNG